MFWKTFLIWASHKLNFIRGFTWFIAGFALAVNSMVLGCGLLVLALVFNFFACRLEIAANGVLSSGSVKSTRMQNKASSDSLSTADLLSVLSALKK